MDIVIVIEQEAGEESLAGGRLVQCLVVLCLGSSV